MKPSKSEPAAIRKKTYTLADMAAIFNRSGIHLTAEQTGQMWAYHQLLRSHNPDLNLTRIHSFPNMVLKLYVDSVFPGQLMALPSPLMDLGSGPGMPGIPLKIAFPHLDIILAEGRGKRVAFLETVIQKLNLKGISVVGKRITPQFDQPVAGVITRAVEEIPATLDRVGGCLGHEGLVIFMKGPRCADEIEKAGQISVDAYTLVENRSYLLPHSPHERRLVVFRRTVPSLSQQKERAMERYTVRRIESDQNPFFRNLKKTLTTRGAKKERAALVSGAKLVMDAFRSMADRCQAWITDSDRTPPPENAPPDLLWHQLAPALFEQVDVFGTHSPLLLIRVDNPPVWSPADGFTAGCNLLIPFQDPENVGAVVRSAVAFGVSRIILLEESAHPFHPKAIRASAGAVFHARFMQGPPIQELPADLPILSLSGEGLPISPESFGEAFGLLPGIEGPGLPAHLRVGAFSIPIHPGVESLNAATAVAIALYVWNQGRIKTGAPPTER